MEVTIEGDIKKDGMIIDFSKLKDVVEKEIIEKLDHQALNDMFENPTAEYIIKWIAQQLKNTLPLYSLRLWEGQGKWVEILV